MNEEMDSTWYTFCFHTFLALHILPRLFVTDFTTLFFINVYIIPYALNIVTFFINSCINTIPFLLYVCCRSRLTDLMQSYYNNKVELPSLHIVCAYYM